MRPDPPPLLGLVGEQKNPFWKRIFSRRGLRVVLVILLIAEATGFGLWYFQSSLFPWHYRAAVPHPRALKALNPLTGVLGDPAGAKLPVVGVVIENLYPDARPQSGLGQAPVVYEALAEGGITRFLAVFQEPLPGNIGPVRSLRPYFLDFGLEYDIPVAHAGGSQPALAEIGPLGMKNIDALVYSGSYFYRSTDRLAPHNLYAHGDQLEALVAKLGFAAPPHFTPLPRKKAAPPKAPAVAAHPDIKIDFSSPLYNAEYRYDATMNSYAFVNGGTPQADRNTGEQIYVRNVVVIMAPTRYGTQPDGKPETDIQLVGSGTGYVFMDGGTTTIKWSKVSEKAQMQITDQAGTPVKFDPGNTWYSIVPAGRAVTY